MRYVHVSIRTAADLSNVYRIRADVVARLTTQAGASPSLWSWSAWVIFSVGSYSACQRAASENHHCKLICTTHGGSKSTVFATMDGRILVHVQACCEGNRSQGKCESHYWTVGRARRPSVEADPIPRAANSLPRTRRRTHHPSVVAKNKNAARARTSVGRNKHVGRSSRRRKRRKRKYMMTLLRQPRASRYTGFAPAMRKIMVIGNQRLSTSKRFHEDARARICQTGFSILFSTFLSRFEPGKSNYPKARARLGAARPRARDSGGGGAAPARCTPASPYTPTDSEYASRPTSTDATTAADRPTPSRRWKPQPRRLLRRTPESVRRNYREIELTL